MDGIAFYSAEDAKHAVTRTFKLTIKGGTMKENGNMSQLFSINSQSMNMNAISQNMTKGQPNGMTDLIKWLLFVLILTM